MTIISTDRKFVFVHLHKCGGTSIERCYDDVALYNDVILGSTEMGEKIQHFYRTKFGIHKHSNATVLANLLGTKRWQEYETFALVRNPFAVYESFYTWIESIFSFHANQVGLTIDELKNRILAGNSGFHFESWGSSQAFASTHDFNSFIDFAIRLKKLPQQSYLHKLGLDQDSTSVKNVFKLEEIEKLYTALEMYINKPLRRLHENKSNSSRRFVWLSSHVDHFKNIHKDCLERFDYETPPTY